MIFNKLILKQQVFVNFNDRDRHLLLVKPCFQIINILYIIRNPIIMLGYSNINTWTWTTRSQSPTCDSDNMSSKGYWTSWIATYKFILIIYFKNSLNFSKNYRKRLVLWKLQDRPFRVLPSETCYTADDASSILHLSSHSFELLVTVWPLCGRRDGRNPNLKYQKFRIYWKFSQWKFCTCNCHPFIRINEETSKWNWSCNRWVNNRHEKSNDGDICVDVHTVIEVSWVSNNSKWTVP